MGKGLTYKLSQKKVVTFFLNPAYVSQSDISCCEIKQVLNPQKGFSGTHSFKLRYTNKGPAVNSLRSESSNIGFVVLHKLQVGFPLS